MARASGSAGGGAIRTLGLPVGAAADSAAGASDAEAASAAAAASASASATTASEAEAAVAAAGVARGTRTVFGLTVLGAATSTGTISAVPPGAPLTPTPVPISVSAISAGAATVNDSCNS